MEDDKVKSLELVQLTERFVKALEKSDKETVAQIVSNKLKLKAKIVGNSSIHYFDKNNLEEIFISSYIFETLPYFYLYRNRAKIVYEKNTWWNIKETAFQRGFIRHSFFYKKFKNTWKLYYLKQEYNRFSRYNLKDSLDGLFTWIMVKTGKVNG